MKRREKVKSVAVAVILCCRCRGLRCVNRADPERRLWARARRPRARGGCHSVAPHGSPPPVAGRAAIRRFSGPPSRVWRCPTTGVRCTTRQTAANSAARFTRARGCQSTKVACDKPRDERVRHDHRRPTPVQVDPHVRSPVSLLARGLVLATSSFIRSGGPNQNGEAQPSKQTPHGIMSALHARRAISYTAMAPPARCWGHCRRAVTGRRPREWWGLR
jgi:hypothetical protein